LCEMLGEGGHRRSQGVEGSGVQAGDLEAASRLANPGGSKQRPRREANGAGW
jgi:hypothetical protein